jgi:ATP/ADP translocase
MSTVRSRGWWPLALWTPFLALTTVALVFSTLAMIALRGDRLWLYALHAVGGAPAAPAAR